MLTNSEGALEEVSDGSEEGYYLKLTYGAGAGQTETNPPKIDKIVKRALTFGETWEITYTNTHKLESVRITRDDMVLREVYDTDDRGLPHRLTRTLYPAEDDTVLTVKRENETLLLDLVKTPDTNAGGHRFSGGTYVSNSASRSDAAAAHYTVEETYRYAGSGGAARGQLSGIEETLQVVPDTENPGTEPPAPLPGGTTFRYNGFRQVAAQTRTVRGTQTPSNATHAYDAGGRRVAGATRLDQARAVYFYHENRLLAIGRIGIGDRIVWTHAIGHGPMGPTFIKGLADNVPDSFIFTDHLGTPYAYTPVVAGELQTPGFTPFNPWGELPARPTNPVTNSPLLIYTDGNVPESNLPVASDPVFGIPPLGLAGHAYDPSTGLTYMMARYYHPRLGLGGPATASTPTSARPTSSTPPASPNPTPTPPATPSCSGILMVYRP